MRAWCAVFFVMFSVFPQSIFGDKCTTTAKGDITSTPRPMRPVTMDVGVPSFCIDVSKSICNHGRQGLVIIACDYMYPDIMICDELNKAEVLRKGRYRTIGSIYVTEYCDRTLQAAPQLISVPIALPGAKPGDPQPTVQIQVLNPNILQQKQPKYQMQIPIQGLQQGAVLTVAYSPDANDGSGIQLLGNALPDGTFRIRSGLQVLTMPHEMQLIQPAQAQMQDNKEHIQQQIFITQNQQQLVINSGTGDRTAFVARCISMSTMLMVMIFASVFY